MKPHKNILENNEIPQLLKNILINADDNGNAVIQLENLENQQDAIGEATQFKIQIHADESIPVIKHYEIDETNGTLLVTLDPSGAELKDSDLTMVHLTDTTLATETVELIAQRLQTPDGTIIASGNNHLTVSHLDANGCIYNVCKRYKATPELAIYSDAPHDIIRKVLSWGSYGIKGDQPLHFITLDKMTTEHIKAVLNTQSLTPAYTRSMLTELSLRDEKKQ